MKIKTVHPFPARMAPDIALEQLSKVGDGNIVLDPMAGSGTVLRQAAELGLTAKGFDLDPLAVLMSRVSTSKCDPDNLVKLANVIVNKAKSLDGRRVRLDWIDSDNETKEFIKYWFGEKQRRDLRKLVYAIMQTAGERPVQQIDIIKIALSRIIVTKESKASLARDTSHSRPHKVMDDSDYEIFSGFLLSVRQLAEYYVMNKFSGKVSVKNGDARKLSHVKDGSIDLIVTSPPYLNAIDYLRGHKLALVWLGYTVGEIRGIRSESIGSEKSVSDYNSVIAGIASASGDLTKHDSRITSMIMRYAKDMYLQLHEASRVLKLSARAVYVVGNSCLKGNFVNNAAIVSASAEMCGFKLLHATERELPLASRYLPPPNSDKGTLAKRMRTESVLTFEKV